MKIDVQEYMLDEVLWPGDVLEVTYSLFSVNPFMVATWLDGIERSLAKQHFAKYLGYLWNPDVGYITFRLEINPYVQDLETGKLVPLVDGRLHPEDARELQEASIGETVKYLAVILITIVGCMMFQEVCKVLISSNARRIAENPDLTPEEKREALDVIEKAQTPTSERILTSATKAATGAIGVAVAVAASFLIVLWLARGSAGARL